VVTDQRGLAERRRPDDAEDLHTVDRPKEGGEPVRLARPVRAQGGMIVALQAFALIVDDLDERLTEDRVRIGLEGLQASLEKGRLELVVMCRPLEVLAGRQLEGPVEVGRRPDVARLAVVANPRVRRRIALANLGRIIG
jgi:hypothetical protein